LQFSAAAFGIYSEARQDLRVSHSAHLTMFRLSLHFVTKNEMRLIGARRIFPDFVFFD